MQTGTAKVFDSDAPMSGDRGDNDLTLAVGQDAPIQVFSTALTKARAITISTTGADNGDSIHVVHESFSNFALSVNGNAVAAQSWAEFMFNGTIWKKIAGGSL